MEAVEAATQEQLGRWWRFLPSPGLRAIRAKDFQDVLQKEVKVMERIVARFNELGGWNPTLSKRIGLDP